MPRAAIATPFDEAAYTADVAEMHRVRRHIRRLSIAGINAGRTWSEATTIGEVAASARLAPGDVVAMIRRFSMWLLAVTEIPGRPMVDWWVFEDGE